MARLARLWRDSNSQHNERHALAPFRAITGSTPCIVDIYSPTILLKNDPAMRGIRCSIYLSFLHRSPP
jgi:hypothetical protein